MGVCTGFYQGVAFVCSGKAEKDWLDSEKHWTTVLLWILQLQTKMCQQSKEKKFKSLFIILVKKHKLHLVSSICKSFIIKVVVDMTFSES